MSINEHRRTSTNINEHPRRPTNSNEHQRISTNINEQRRTSTKSGPECFCSRYSCIWCLFNKKVNSRRPFSAASRRRANPGPRASVGAEAESGHFLMRTLIAGGHFPPLAAGEEIRARGASVRTEAESNNFLLRNLITGCH